MCKRKKGVTLIECIVYMAILSTFGFLIVKNIMNMDYLYMKTNKEYINRSDIDDFFSNIERFVNEDNVRSINVENNNLIIYKGNLEKNFEKQEIFKESNKVLIKYYDIRNFEDYNTRNTLAYDIEDFKVKVKGKLIYLSIKKGGKEYIKCL